MFDVFSSALAFRGRIGRGSYWGLTGFCMLGLFGSAVSVALTANHTNASPVNVVAIAFAIVGAIFFLVMCMVLFGTGVCRLRDRGKSGFWIMPYYLMPFALALLAMDPDGQRGYLDWVAVAILGWAMIDLGMLTAAEPAAA